jgi:hypothetical protein
VTFASCYRVEAVVPPSVQLGVPYELRLDSGLRGPGIPAGGATTVVPRLVFGAAAGDWPPARFQALVRCCWDTNPAARPDFLEVIELLEEM